MLLGVSGIELCRRWRTKDETANIPIIMITARGEEEERVRGLIILAAAPCTAMVFVWFNRDGNPEAIEGARRDAGKAASSISLAVLAGRWSGDEGRPAAEGATISHPASKRDTARSKR